jgi:CheY-like chemotaxis protein
MSASPSGLGLLLCDDLMFGSRITGTARDLGAAVKIASSVDRLRAMAEAQPPSCLIVDLAHPGLDLDELVAWLRASGRPVPRIVAYGSHVDVEKLQRARQAGCDPVLPRSRFVEELPRQLVSWLASGAA